MLLQLKKLFLAAVERCQPGHCLLNPLRDLASDLGAAPLVISIGKAAPAMARVSAATIEPVSHRLVVAPPSSLEQDVFRNGALPELTEVIASEHPTPGAGSIEAGLRVLELVSEARGNHNVLCLLSGGGSSLMEVPAAGVELSDLQLLTRQLLHSGADIAELNTVRKHLSKVKGGRLAATAQPSRIFTLSVSDVVSDDPSAIASGPTVPDPTRLEDARAVLSRHGIKPSTRIREALQAAENETPKRLSNASGYRIVAANDHALETAARKGELLGFRVSVLGQQCGEARELGARHASMLKEAHANPEPQLVLSGGETTVTVRHSGRGGRNTEYLLGLICALQGAAEALQRRLYALAADTDGIDGSEQNAGALWTPEKWRSLDALRHEPEHYLCHNDAYTFFEQLGLLLTTGPTGTNVNDFRALALQAQSTP